MQEELDKSIREAKNKMNDSVDHLRQELSKVRTGKASPSMVDSIKVSYYGSQTPLNQVANVSASDSRTIVIQPREKSIIDDIEKAIFEANLGLTPQNDGDVIHINVPPLTEERRKEMVKYTKTLGEDTKVSLRNARQKAMSAIKSAMKDGYPEDVAKRQESDIESLTSKYSKMVDDTLEAKESEIMKV